MDWSNNACLGYVIKSMKELGYSDEKIKELISEIKFWFDMKTVDEAADIYRTSIY